MATQYKRLGATQVVASTDTQLYTVPASTETVVGLIQITNRGSATRTFRLAVVDGAISTVSLEDYLHYDADIPAHTAASFNIGVTIPANYTLLVHASHADVHFQAFGAEMT